METQRFHNQPDDGLWLLGQTRCKAEQPEYTDSPIVSAPPLDERCWTYWEWIFGKMGDEESDCEEGVGALFEVGESAVAEGEYEAIVSRLRMTK